MASIAYCNCPTSLADKILLGDFGIREPRRDGAESISSGYGVRFGRTT